MQSNAQQQVDEFDAKQMLSKINAHEKARAVLNTPVYRYGMLMSLVVVAAPVLLLLNMPWPFEIKVLLGLSIGVSSLLVIEFIHLRRRLEAAIVLLNERESL
jgi:hypothetical protein